MVLKGKYMLNLAIATANADGTPYREPLKRLTAFGAREALARNHRLPVIDRFPV